MVKPVLSLTGAATATGATTYYSFDSGTSAISSSVLTTLNQAVGIAGTISNLTIALTAAPGVGASIVYTLYQNTIATALTCTVSNLATTASDTTHSVTVAVGDLLAWQAAPSVTPAPAASRVCLSSTYTGTADGECNISGGTASVSGTVTNYQSLYGGTPNATQSVVANIMPTSGTIDNFYVNLNASPGSPASYVFTVYKNGVATAITCTIVNSATIGTDTTHSVSYAAGDTISIESVPNTAPTARTTRFALRFRPTTNGESLVFNNTTSWTNNAVRFDSMLGTGGNNATESNMQAVAPVSFVLKNLYMGVDVAPTGATKTWNIVSRKNTTVGNLTATITDMATTANDISNSDSLVSGDLIDWRTTPANTPSAIGMGAISGVMFIQSATSSINSMFLNFSRRF